MEVVHGSMHSGLTETKFGAWKVLIYILRSHPMEETTRKYKTQKNVIFKAEAHFVYSITGVI